MDQDRIKDLESMRDELGASIKKVVDPLIGKPVTQMDAMGGFITYAALLHNFFKDEEAMFEVLSATLIAYSKRMRITVEKVPVIDKRFIN